MTESTIPPEVLTAPGPDRLAYFRKKKVMHEELKKTRAKLLSRIRNAGRDRIIFLYGASGSGKSTLCRSIVKKIWDDRSEELMVDPGRIPALCGELDFPSSYLNWSDAYRSMLHAGGEPLIELKKTLPGPKLGVEFPRSDRASAERYLRAYLSMLQHRKTEVSILDNANFLDLIRTNRKDQILNPVISMCREVPHVLAGTHPLLSLRRITGQVARRSRPGPIHLRRYQLGNDDDEDAFEEAVNKLAGVLPVSLRPDLVDHLEFLFGGCIGCIGLLKDWLTDALELAIEEGAETITKEHLILTYMDSEELSQLEADAKAGEDLLANTEKMRASMRAGLPKAAKEQGQPTHADPQQIDDAKEQQAAKPLRKTGKRKIGKRNPKRDPVGIHLGSQD